MLVQYVERCRGEGFLSCLVSISSILLDYRISLKATFESLFQNLLDLHTPWQIFFSQGTSFWISWGLLVGSLRESRKNSWAILQDSSKNPLGTLAIPTINLSAFWGWHLLSDKTGKQVSIHQLFDSSWWMVHGSRFIAIALSHEPLTFDIRTYICYTFVIHQQCIEHVRNN